MSVEGRPLIEQELIQKASNGDVAAFEELVAMHRAIALRVAILVVGDPSDAAAAARTAWVCVWPATASREMRPHLPRRSSYPRPNVSWSWPR